MARGMIQYKRHSFIKDHLKLALQSPKHFKNLGLLIQLIFAWCAGSLDELAMFLHHIPKGCSHKKLSINTPKDITKKLSIDPQKRFSPKVNFTRDPSFLFIISSSRSLNPFLGHLTYFPYFRVNHFPWIESSPIIYHLNIPSWFCHLNLNNQPWLCHLTLSFK